MLLPQSSAFATLRNRLSAVSSLGLLQSAPKSAPFPLCCPSLRSQPLTPPRTQTRRTYAASTTPAVPRGSTLLRRDEIPWSSLLTHFRLVQKRRSSAAAATTTLGDALTDQPAPVVARRKPPAGIPRAESGPARAPGWRGAGARSTSPPGAPKRRFPSAPPTQAQLGKKG